MTEAEAITKWRKLQAVAAEGSGASHAEREAFQGTADRLLAQFPGATAEGWSRGRPGARRLRCVCAPVGRRVRLQTDAGPILDPCYAVGPDYVAAGTHEVIHEGVELPPLEDVPAEEPQRPKLERKRREKKP